MNKKDELKPFSLVARGRSFVFALAGLQRFFLLEHNARIHLVATVAAIAGGFYFHLSSTEWMALLIVTGLVWITEIINTVIEHIMDLLSPGYDTRVGYIKDLAAGAVLVAALIAGVTGIIIFIPKLF